MDKQSTTTLFKGRSRWVLAALLIAAGGVVAASVVSRSGMREGTIPAGTRMVGALQHTVSTEKSNVGDRVALTIADPIHLAEGTTLPAGAVLSGEVSKAQGGGRIAGAPELGMRFTQLEVEGRRYDVAAEPFRVRGSSEALESAAEIGGGAVVGGVVGALAHKTIEGAVIGAVIGTGVAVATKGDQIVLSTGQKLRVTLSDAVKVRYKPGEENAPAKKPNR